MSPEWYYLNCELRTLPWKLDVMKSVLDGEFEIALEKFQKLKEENPKALFDNLKLNINGIGNSYNWNDQPEMAYKTFKLNAKANPNWWIAMAGLAEMQETRKDTLNALKNYQRALLLNEKNEYNYNEGLQSKIKELKQ